VPKRRPFLRKREKSRERGASARAHSGDRWRTTKRETLAGLLRVGKKGPHFQGAETWIKGYVESAQKAWNLGKYLCEHNEFEITSGHRRHSELEREKITESVDDRGGVRGVEERINWNAAILMPPTYGQFKKRRGRKTKVYFTETPNNSGPNPIIANRSGRTHRDVFDGDWLDEATRLRETGEPEKKGVFLKRFR